MHVQFLIDVAEKCGAHELVDIVPDLLDGDLHFLIVLVDIAYDLLNQVLHGHHTTDTAVLIHDDGHLVVVLLHLLEDCIRLHVLRDEVGGLDELPDIHVIEASLLLCLDGKVLHADHADDVVDIFLIDRDPAVAGCQQLVDIFIHRNQQIHCHHILAIHHDLPDSLIVEGEDGCDHFLLDVVEDAGLRSCLDQGLDLLLGYVCLQVIVVQAEDLQEAVGTCGKEPDKG